MSDHEVRPLNVVDRAIWLDKVFAHSMNVVDHNQLDLLVIDTGWQVLEKFGVFIDVVALRELDAASSVHISDGRCLSCRLILSHSSRLGQKVVYRN